MLFSGTSAKPNSGVQPCQNCIHVFRQFFFNVELEESQFSKTATQASKQCYWCKKKDAITTLNARTHRCCCSFTQFLVRFLIPRRLGNHDYKSSSHLHAFSCVPCSTVDPFEVLRISTIPTKTRAVQPR